LKERLDRLDQEPATRRPAGRRTFFIGGIVAGSALALALSLFVARTSPTLRDRPASAAPSLPVEDHHAVLAPDSTTSSTPDVAGATLDQATPAHPVDPAPGALTVGATVLIYPSIKEATRFINRNMNVSATLAEPKFAMMSSEVLFAALCADGGSIDAAVADRRILPAELEVCHRGRKHVAEVKLGYEAIVVARSKLYEAPKLSTRSLFLALAREIPDSLHPEVMIKNPNLTWDQVDSTLPNERIDVSGPPLSSATGIALRDLLMKAGCVALPTIASLKTTDPERFEQVCGSVRTDGAYRETDISRRLASGRFDLVGYLQANPEAMALLGYREDLFLSLGVTAGSMDGITPNRSSISTGAYPGARVLYLYVNTSAPHMRELAMAIWSSMASDSDPPLTALDDAELRSIRQQLLTLQDLYL